MKSLNILEVAIPSIQDDPVERKRLQGVMAQRRYRRRKKAAKLQSTALTDTTERENSVSRTGTINDEPDQDQIVYDVSKHSLPLPRQINVYGDPTHPPARKSLSVQVQEDLSTPIRSTDKDNEWEGYVDHSAPSNVLTTNLGALESDNTAAASDRPTISPISTIERPSDQSDMQQRSSAEFADSTCISAPLLNLVKVHITILQSIKGPDFHLDTIWNPYAESPFAPGSLTMPLDTLRANYVPSALQLTIPHHPVIDLMPWPTVRDKILQLLSLPVEYRPKKLQRSIPEINVQLKLDMMDAAGGIRVSGLDPFDQDNWEVGQHFFEQYWWLLDADIIKRSNTIRRSRGQDALYVPVESH